jgi:hypothetical protein
MSIVIYVYIQFSLPENCLCFSLVHSRILWITYSNCHSPIDHSVYLMRRASICRVLTNQSYKRFSKRGPAGPPRSCATTEPPPLHQPPSPQISHQSLLPTTIDTLNHLSKSSINYAIRSKSSRSYSTDMPLRTHNRSLLHPTTRHVSPSLLLGKRCSRYRKVYYYKQKKSQLDTNHFKQTRD